MALYLPPAVGSQGNSLQDPRLISGTAFLGSGSAAAVASYIDGQCTWFVANDRDWVPAHWGHAKQWADNAKAQGFVVTNSPHVGAVAAWPGVSDYGHVAVVKSVNPNGSFTVEEMNYSGGPFNKDTRTVPSPQGAQFILPPGSNTSHGIPNPGDLAGAITKAFSPSTWIQDIATGFGRQTNDLVIDVGLIILGLGFVMVGALILFQIGPTDVAKVAVAVPK